MQVNITKMSHILQNPSEPWCCVKLESRLIACKDNLVLEDLPTPASCITLHPGFRPICPDKFLQRNGHCEVALENIKRGIKNNIDKLDLSWDVSAAPFTNALCSI